MRMDSRRKNEATTMRRRRRDGAGVDADPDRLRDPGGMAEPKRGGVLVVLACAQICTACDNCLVGIAAQSIMDTMAAGYDEVQMATMVYSLVAGAFMIFGGLLGVVVGWRRNLRLGIGLALAGEIVLVTTTDIGLFIWGGRGLVGLGASLIVPSVLGMVPLYFSGGKRLTAFGAIAAAAGFATLSPIPFGVMLDTVGLRPSFMVLAGMFALLLVGTLALPEPRVSDKNVKIDVVGVALGALGLGLLMVGASRLPAWGVWRALPGCPVSIAGISPALPMICFGIAVLAVFLAHEKRYEVRCGYALLPRSFVSTPRVRAGLLAVAIPYVYSGAQSIVMTPYIQLVGGLNATQTGMLALLSGIPMLLFSLLIPKLLPHAVPRSVIRFGYALLAVGSFTMAFSLNEHGVGLGLFVAVFLAGCGSGVVNSHANNAVASAVNTHDAEQSGGIQGTARNLGTAFGAALMGTTLLLTLSLSFGMEVKDIPADDPAKLESLAASEVAFVSDEAFEELVAEEGIEGATGARLIEANAHARMIAARSTMLVLGGMLVLCGVLGTRKLNGKSMA